MGLALRDAISSSLKTARESLGQDFVWKNGVTSSECSAAYCLPQIGPDGQVIRGDSRRMADIGALIQHLQII
jgi:hypothetical protein